jgi:hypothetical protein
MVKLSPFIMYLAAYYLASRHRSFRGIADFSSRIIISQLIIMLCIFAALSSRFIISRLIIMLRGFAVSLRGL